MSQQVPNSGSPREKPAVGISEEDKVGTTQAEGFHSPGKMGFFISATGGRGQPGCQAGMCPDSQSPHPVAPDFPGRARPWPVGRVPRQGIRGPLWGCGSALDCHCVTANGSATSLHLGSPPQALPSLWGHPCGSREIQECGGAPVPSWLSTFILDVRNCCK